MGWQVLSLIQNHRKMTLQAKRDGDGDTDHHHGALHVAKHLAHTLVFTLHDATSR